jgi:hypothetical protein
VAALLADRLAMVADADSRVDWAMAEALAIGTLLLHRWVAMWSASPHLSIAIFPDLLTHDCSNASACLWEGSNPWSNVCCVLAQGQGA